MRSDQVSPHGYRQHPGAEPVAVPVPLRERLRDRHVEGIILGWTEVPLLLGEHAAAAALLNPPNSSPRRRSSAPW